VAQEETSQRDNLQDQVNSLEVNIAYLTSELNAFSEKEKKFISLVKEFEVMENNYISELVEKDDEIGRLYSNIEELSQRAGGAEQDLDVANERIETLMLEINGLKENVDEVTKLDKARNDQTKALRCSLSQQLVMAIASATAEKAEYSALAQVAEIRTHKAEVDQACLSTVVQQTQSVVTDGMRRLEKKVASAEKTLRVRDDRIKELNLELAKVNNDRKKIEVEFQKAAQQHSVRLQTAESELAELRAAKEKQSLVNELTLVTPKPVSKAVPKSSKSIFKSLTESTDRPSSVKKLTSSIFSDSRRARRSDDVEQLRGSNRDIHNRILNSRSALEKNREAARLRESRESPVAVTKTSIAPSSVHSTPTTTIIIPKQLSMNTPIKSTEIVVDKENIRQVENAGTISGVKGKSSSKLQRRLSLRSPEGTMKKQSATPRSIRKSRKSHLQQSATVL